VVPDESIEKLDLGYPRGDWRGLNNELCRELGSGWAASGRAMGCQAPSAAVDGDWNVLLNPKHAELGRVRIGEAKPFRNDERMFR